MFGDAGMVLNNSRTEYPARLNIHYPVQELQVGLQTRMVARPHTIS